MTSRFQSVLNEMYASKKALIAFNLQNDIHLKALKEATECLQLPVIAQFSAKNIKPLDERFGFKLLIEKYKSKFMYFHLDHCMDINLIKFCIDIGFDSVMFDGSSLPLDENIKLSKEINEYAIARGCLIEGELGEIGGVEDGFGSEKIEYVDLQDVKKYVDSTNIALLALGIGNSHGFYKSLNKIDTSILKKAKEIIGKDQFMVLHGGTGLSEKIVRESINCGVVKINYSTQLKYSTQEAIKSYTNETDLFNETSFFNKIVNSIQPTFSNLIVKYTS